MKVGQKLYTNEKSSIKEWTIIKIGRKYVYLDKWSRNKVYLESLIEVTDYGAAKQYYRTKQEIEDINEANRIHSEIEESIGRYRPIISLKALREIKKIIDNDKTQIK